MTLSTCFSVRFSPRIPKLPSTASKIRSSSSASAPPSFDLRSYWSSLLSEINSSLSSAVPVVFPESIHLSMRHSVLSPAAKRAAPVLCIAAACDLLGSPLPAALPAACALEMVHSASLVHDDLPCMDASPLRRGRPSTHSLFGTALAVLAGDALFPLAFHHVVSRTPPALLPPPALLALLAEIARAVGSRGMARGQYLDLHPPASAVSALEILERKFGEMAECSAVCGGIVGGAGEEELRRLRRYGRAVGVLYPLVDDVLMEEKANGMAAMRSNASVVRALGMERALMLVDELRTEAKRELDEGFGDRYGDRLLPLYSFVDYAVERGFDVTDSTAAAAADSAGNNHPCS